MSETTCEACGEPMPAKTYRDGETPRGNPKRFCGATCQHWANRNPGVRRSPTLVCAAMHCDAVFARDGRKRFCSKFCSEVAHGQRRIPGSLGYLITCEWCGKDGYVSYLPAKVCSEECRVARDAAIRKQWRVENPERVREFYRRRDQRRSAQRRGISAVAEDITASEVYERDGWRCGLCGGRVPKARRHPHPKSASLDHIVPLSLGGTHTLDNVQIAHLSCNVRKGVKAMNEQLLLVG